MYTFIAGFALGWLVFRRPELIERYVVDPIKNWWAKR